MLFSRVYTELPTGSKFADRRISAVGVFSLMCPICSTISVCLITNHDFPASYRGFRQPTPMPITRCVLSNGATAETGIQTASRFEPSCKWVSIGQFSLLSRSPDHVFTTQRWPPSRKQACTIRSGSVNEKIEDNGASAGQRAALTHYR